MFKNFVQKRLENYVRKYFAKHHPKLIVVVGGAGKTTTKVAIATVLSQKYRVQMEETNHNDQMSVPLGILGVTYPENEELHRIGTWLRVFRACRKRIKWETGVDVIVQELGTDHPGEIPHFGTYLHPDIAVVTSIVPEHMESFPNMDAVAAEELSVASYSNLLVVNRDDVDQSFAKFANTSVITTYGTDAAAEYHFEIVGGSPLEGYTGNFASPEYGKTAATVRLVGEHNLRAGVAAGAVAAKLGMSGDEIAAAMTKIQPVAGRMSVLAGFRETILLDDTYNSSPQAAIAALTTLYQIDAPQRIAILGSMNELGELSAQMHADVGRTCDPNKLEWVITVGEEANNYLAPAARRQGCQVQSVANALEAGAFANKVMQPHTVLLLKGSQDKIFLEEATKLLLAHIDDEKNLVRQTSDWMKKKNDFFQSAQHFSAMPQMSTAPINSASTNQGAQNPPAKS